MKKSCIYLENKQTNKQMTLVFSEFCMLFLHIIKLILSNANEIEINNFIFVSSIWLSIIKANTKYSICFIILRYFQLCFGKHHFLFFFFLFYRELDKTEKPFAISLKMVYKVLAEKKKVCKQKNEACQGHSNVVVYFHTKKITKFILIKKRR